MGHHLKITNIRLRIQLGGKHHIMHEALTSTLLTGKASQPANQPTSKTSPSLSLVSLWTSVIAVTQWGYIGEISVHEYSQALAN